MPRPRGSPEPVQIGALLAGYRRKRGLSQETLAGRAGLDRTYIGMIERGERSPTLLAVWSILDALDVDWAEFGARLDAIERT
jgi:transcriptional regulator with XRE-family HTH domain